MLHSIKEFANAMYLRTFCVLTRAKIDFHVFLDMAAQDHGSDGIILVFRALD